MHDVEIYTTPFCGYCARAKRLLDKRGVHYLEIDVSFNSAKRREMMDRAGGRTSVPQIFIKGDHVGGYDDLAELDMDGELEDRLTG